MAATTSALPGSGYPERAEAREGKLERLMTAVRYLTGKAGTAGKRLARIEAATDAAARGLEGLTDEQLLGRAAELRQRLRRAGFRDLALAGASFALVREAARRNVGQRHFGVQLIGGWAMLNGMLAEMETGEGKTLTATLTAATAA
ncbi:MAG: preprotein translocase subunit SecA, partial [Burkholderiales bacterium]